MPDDTVSLREHLDLVTRVAVLETNMNANAVQLKLQAAEYERRLDGLNGEQARLASARRDFVSVLAYDTFKETLEPWRDTVNRFMAANAGRDAGIGTSWGVLVAAGGLLIAGGCGAAAIIVSVGLFLAGRP